MTQVTSTRVAICKAQREEASILYYPPASLASWRIFHLILAVMIENWPCRCVPYSILLPRFLLYSSSNLRKQEAHIATLLSGSRLAMTDFNFARRDIIRTALFTVGLRALREQLQANTFLTNTQCRHN